MNLTDLERCREEHGQAIRDFFIRRGCAPDRADELAGKAFLDLFGEMQCQPWLTDLAGVVIYRVALDLLRKNGKGADPADPGFLTLTPRDRAFRRALRVLDPIDREIVTLQVWEGLAPIEIGIILAMKTDVVQDRLRDALARLAAEPGDEPPDDGSLGSPIPAQPKPPCHPDLRAGLDPPSGS